MSNRHMDTLPKIKEKDYELKCMTEEIEFLILWVRRMHRSLGCLNQYKASFSALESKLDLAVKALGAVNYQIEKLRNPQAYY